LNDWFLLPNFIQHFFLFLFFPSIFEFSFIFQ
jgi:hypothetical protein